MREIRNKYKISVRKSVGSSLSEDLEVDGKIIFRWIMKTKSEKMWRRFFLFRA
jgi:hypothetical protein